MVDTLSNLPVVKKHYGIDIRVVDKKELRKDISEMVEEIDRYSYLTIISLNNLLERVKHNLTKEDYTPVEK